MRNLLATFLSILAATLLFSLNVMAQQANASAAAATVFVMKYVEVTEPVKEADVAQQVTLKALPRDAAGNVASDKPAPYSAGPMHTDDDHDKGHVNRFGPGVVTVGAIVDKTPGFDTIVV